MSFDLPVVHNPSNTVLQARLQTLIDNKTKPLASLGKLEALAVQIGVALGTESPVLEEPQLIVFAGDHGLTRQGVSAYPSDVTWQMVENFLAGGAAVSVLARQHGLSLSVVDCGVQHDFTARNGLYIRKIGYGTGNSFEGPAMSIPQCGQAMNNGMELLRSLPGNVLLLGEMGIGNTSAASLLMARFTGHDIAECTGAGTGLNAEAVQRKASTLREVLHRHKNTESPMEILAAMGGFEIATMVGAVLQAASERRVVVVDGFIATAAVLVAHAMCPNVLAHCIFAHQSGEQGHRNMLKYLNAQPLLDLGMRLGEGSGAALAWPLLVSACALLRDMASFDSASVSRADLSTSTTSAKASLE
ncbi:nicotinate-nucleotide--dimethylbenzimidazole phosphoribosyltransferase [uncultured Limnobacter sp.]|uniref:nicotinate-nucleotide--dimethylbenzimidazole phosphoribosyltransferase n=1 Tax=uncultured Limnobacter sp. TaxID=199681 RepID=UPI0030FB87EE